MFYTSTSAIILIITLRKIVLIVLLFASRLMTYRRDTSYRPSVLRKAKIFEIFRFTKFKY